MTQVQKNRIKPGYIAALGIGSLLNGGVRTLDGLLRVRTSVITRAGATATETILAEPQRRGYR